jgi:hypothetical protein
MNDNQTQKIATEIASPILKKLDVREELNREEKKSLRK